MYEIVKVSSSFTRQANRVGTVIGGSDGYKTVEFDGGDFDSIPVYHLKEITSHEEIQPANNPYKKGDIVRIIPNPTSYTPKGLTHGCIATVTSITTNGGVHVKSMYGAVAHFWVSELIPVTNDPTPLEMVEKKYKKQMTVTLVDKRAVVSIRPTLRDLIDLINNPSTKWVYVQFKNGKTFKEFNTSTGFNGAFECLNHKREYVWVLVGGE